MKLFVPDPVDQYAHDHSRGFGALHDELREKTYANVALPQMQVGRVEGRFLAMLVGLIGARRVLEIGTFTGYSALSMAEALPDDGRLITCDRDPEVTAIARDFFDRSGHGAKIRIVLGDALTTLASLDDAPFCMAFLDADKARYPVYYDAIIERLKPGGLLVIDNVLWSGEVLDPQTADARGIAEVNEKAQNDPRTENVLLTVRDGVMLVRKRAQR